MDNIIQANASLKALRSRCSIEQRGDKLLLRGTFPPKPDSLSAEWVRSRIFLGVNATPAGIDYAKAQALKISEELDRNQFDWNNYLKDDRTGTANIVAAFRAHKFAQGISDLTWQKDYAEVFKHIPEKAELSPQYLIGLVQTTKPNTRTRRRYCIALGAIAKFAGIEVNLTQYTGSYSPSKVQPRDIPSDEIIIEQHSKFSSKEWRWGYGILATYGIRPSELLCLSFEDLPVLDVTAGKTGARRVYPIYPEWFELFDLSRIFQPKIAHPEQASRQFKNCKIPFRPYDLRHAWAIRSMEFGIPLELAAAQMGHSMAVHSQTYHRWISDRHHQQAFDKALKSRISKAEIPNPTTD